MRIISRKTLRDFWKRHAKAEVPLRAWFHEAQKADWKGPSDIKRRFPSASYLAGNRVVFNIGGNAFRVVVRINYPYRVVYIRFVGTHAAYDKIDAGTI